MKPNLLTLPIIHTYIHTFIHTYIHTRDLERLEKPVYAVQAHGTIINSIDGVGGQELGYGAPELVTGSRDGRQVGR